MDQLWPKCWMHQDATWYGGRPQPRPHCAVWGPAPQLPLMRTQLPSPRRGHSPQISTHVCCGQSAGWIKMPLGTKVGLRPGRIVLHGDPAPLPKGTQPPNFRPMSIVAKRSLISATAEHLSNLSSVILVISSVHS